MNTKYSFEEKVHELGENLFAIQWGSRPDIYELVHPDGHLRSDFAKFLNTLKELIDKEDEDSLCKLLSAKVDMDRFCPLTGADERVLRRSIVSKLMNETEEEKLLAFIGNFSFEFGKKD